MPTVEPPLNRASPLERCVLAPLRQACGPHVRVTATRLFNEMATVVTISQPEHVELRRNPHRPTSMRISTPEELEAILNATVTYDRVEAKQLSCAIPETALFGSRDLEGVLRQVANSIWTQWTSGTSATTNMDAVFFADTTTTAATSANITFNTNAIWNQWMVAPAMFGSTRRQPTGFEAELARRQQAEWAERRLAQERYAKEQAKRAAEAKVAKERAVALLASLLNAEQRRELREKNLFHVKSQLGRTYQIKRGRSGNVVLLDEHGRPEIRYCIHSTMYDIPDEDEMVGQMLMIQGAEADFQRIANATRLQVN